MAFNPFPSDLAYLWDLIALAISFVAVMAVVQINSLVQKKNLLPVTVTRKVVHIFVAPVFILTWPLYSANWYSRYFALVVPIIFVLLFVAIGTGRVKNEAFVHSMSRSGEAAELLKGTLYYALLVAIVTLLWFYTPSPGLANATPNAVIVMGCLAGGDGLADVFGRRYGKHRFGFGGSQKSIEGSVAMFLGSLIFSLALVGALSFEVSAWTMSVFLLPVVVFALGATVIESLSPKNLDNWTVSIGVIVMMGVAYLATPGFWPFPLF